MAITLHKYVLSTMKKSNDAHMYLMVYSRRHDTHINYSTEPYMITTNST